MQGDFEIFTKESGISYEKIVPDASQQNGVAERHNFTFHNMCRSMLLDADLSDWFWPLAIQAAVHIKNRVPHKALPRYTSPYELWNNAKPSLEHLRPFGAHCVSRIIPPKSLSKFQPRGEYGRFMGYAKDSTGYLFWNPSSRSLRVRRDLNFFPSPPPLTFGNGGGVYAQENTLNRAWDPATTEKLFPLDKENNGGGKQTYGKLLYVRKIAHSSVHSNVPKLKDGTTEGTDVIKDVPT
jgi:hypothetical protein